MKTMLDSPSRFAVRLLLLICCLSSPAIVSAQQSGVVGTVRDSSGAVLAGAAVTVKNVNTGEERQASTNGVGQYAVPNLKAGMYDIIAEKQGFQRQQVEKVALEVQLVRTVDFSLPVGSVTDQVNVTAAATALQTTESSVSTLFETKLVNELPLNGRNFLQLQLLAPGVSLGRGGTFSVVQIAAQNTSIGGGNFSVNGMRDVYNDYLMDGVSFKDWIHGTNGMNPSVDAIQEFRTQTSNYSAEFGANAGGLINMVTKSGTNNFHGTAYEFIRNDVFDAENWFSKRAGLEKPPLRRNQFGGTFGGPILRNKTFFFGSYEGFREQRTTPLITTFPTQLMHHGDFSELLTGPNPVIIHDPATGVPYPGNIIPEDQILSVMPGFLDTYIPLPNQEGLVNNNIVPGTRKNTTNQYIGRVDHALTKNLQLFGRYAYNAINDIPPTSNPNFTNSQNNRDHNLSIQLTDTLSPSTIVEARFGLNRFNQVFHQNKAFTEPNIAADVLQINGVSTDPAASGAPAFIVPGYNVSGGGWSPRSWYSNRYEGSGSISLVRGNHLIRAGLHVVRHHETFPEIIIPTGLYVFDGSFTGLSLADMLLGIPQTFLLSPELFDPQFRQTEIMPWVQDDWRVTPKLTINLGLRYERRPWPISNNNTLANVILPPGGGLASEVLSGPCVPNPPERRCDTTLATADAANRSTLGNNDNNNFAPRIGFAYKIGNSDKTVVRGSYGIFYQPEPFNQFVFLSINPPFVSFYNRFNNLSNYQTWDWFNPTAGLPAGGIQFTYIPEDSVTPYLQAWNLGVQRDLGAGIVLDVSYVGNKDTHLWARTWPNQPTPGPGDIESRRPYTNVSTIAGNEPIGNSNYHSLQVRGEKRFSHGLSFLGSYTWGKAITDSQLAETGSFVPDLQNNYDRRANRGLWSADTRHRFTFSSVYELPFGNGKTFLANSHGFGGALISGWQFGGILTLQTGQPLTVVLTYDNPNVGEGAKLPDLVGDPNNGPKTVEKFFNTDAFAAPAPFTFGNEGIGSVIGPGVSNLDLSLVKNTKLTERFNLQFRWEAFNALNHLIMGDPDTNFGTPQFGQVTSTRFDNREMQFALRLEF
jgi:hypothetical protein